jgi:hypothetical protein
MKYMLEAVAFLLKHPETSDEELVVRFDLSEEVVHQIRASLAK